MGHFWLKDCAVLSKKPRAHYKKLHVLIKPGASRITIFLAFTLTLMLNVKYTYHGKYNTPNWFSVYVYFGHFEVEISKVEFDVYCTVNA